MATKATHFVLTCDECQQRIRVRRALEGAEVACPNCDASVSVDGDSDDVQSVDERDAPRRRKERSSRRGSSNDSTSESTEFIEEGSRKPGRRRQLSQKVIDEFGIDQEAEDYDESGRMPEAGRNQLGVPASGLTIPGVLLSFSLAAAMLAFIGWGIINVLRGPDSSDVAEVRNPVQSTQSTAAAGETEAALTTKDVLIPVPRTSSFPDNGDSPQNTAPPKTGATAQKVEQPAIVSVPKVSVAKPSAESSKPRVLPAAVISPADQSLLNSFEERHGDFRVRLPRGLEFLGDSRKSVNGENTHLKVWTLPGQKSTDNASFALELYHYDDPGSSPSDDMLASLIRALAGAGYVSNPEFADMARMTVNGLSVSLLRFKMVNKAGDRCWAFTAMTNGTPRPLIFTAWSPGDENTQLHRAMLASLMSVTHPQAAEFAAKTRAAGGNRTNSSPGPPPTAELLAFDASELKSQAVTAHANRRLILMSVPKLDNQKEFGRHDGRITSVNFHPTQEEVLSTTESGSVYRWNLKTLQQTAHIQLQPSAIWAAEFVGRSQFVTCGDDQLIRVFAAEDSQLRQPEILRGHQAAVTCVAGSENGELLVSGSDDGTARLWNLANQTQLHEFRLPTQRVSDVDINHLHGQVATTFGKTIIISNLKDGTETSRIVCRIDVTQMRIFPNGRYVAVGCADGSRWIYDIESQSIVHEFDKQKDSMVRMLLLGNGAYLFSADITGNLSGGDVPPGFQR